MERLDIDLRGAGGLVHLDALATRVNWTLRVWITVLNRECPPSPCPPSVRLRPSAFRDMDSEPESRRERLGATGFARAGRPVTERRLRETGCWAREA